MGILLFSSSTRVHTYNNRIYNSVTDPDALAFIDVLNQESVLPAIYTSAMDLLIKRLKLIKDVGQTQNLWERHKCIYPFIGATAYKCKFNAKDPQDTDAAYRLTKVGAGSITYANAGVTYSSSALFDTHFVASTGYSVGSRSGFALSTKVDRSTTVPEMGVNQGTNQSYGFFTRNADVGRSQAYGSTTGPTFPNTNAIGIYVSSRPKAGGHFITKNGVVVKVNTGSTESQTRTSVSTPLGGRDNGGTLQYVGAQLHSYAAFFEGCTQLEAIDYYHAIQQFEATLSKT